jgi:hypothetical protein
VTAFCHGTLMASHSPKHRQEKATQEQGSVAWQAGPHTLGQEARHPSSFTLLAGPATVHGSHQCLMMTE